MTEENWDGDLGTREGLYRKLKAERDAKLLAQRQARVRENIPRRDYREERGRRISQFLEEAKKLEGETVRKKARLLMEYKDVTNITNPRYHEYACIAPTAVEQDFEKIVWKVRAEYIKENRCKQNS